ncbi:MAG TPA: type II toxin-antitoxin system VapC family toxin [bacterium]|jgi:predicted nucleic acid-binding protein|nr:type II toxin-antitoxin system VapC family toxin [bacterium]
MKRLRLYLDTTVWNFAFAEDAPDYQKDTLEFFAKIRMGLFDIYSSDAVLNELRDAPEPRQGQVTALLEEVKPVVLDTSPEIDRLAAVYLAKGVLPEKSGVDAYHIAYATFYEMDYLLSWNFRHLANPKRRAKVSALNVDEGYRFPMVIATPLEVLDVE